MSQCCSGDTIVPTYRNDVTWLYTKEGELVDGICHLGLSISYNCDCILCLSEQMGDRACKQFHNDRVVCPSRLHGSVFTTSAVDNIDYNPSSKTSMESLMVLTSLSFNTLCLILRISVKFHYCCKATKLQIS